MQKTTVERRENEVKPPESCEESRKMRGAKKMAEKKQQILAERRIKKRPSAMENIS